ncbi:MAG: chromosome segregation protein SMC [Propionibacteriaceae bacterium]
MYLKSLTLRGFKSFASATTLNFEPGITCIVGPNGSGKSNVVDALSWVMGEQGAKHLRGGKMDDVIFAGTTDRAPLGRAEVVLTIDNSDGALPIDFTEVTISRTMFRSGGSEYAINGHACRLLDVQELLSDSGIGREMHVIVGQGQLDTILSATPEQRRGFIEEAAGVLKHRRRKEKAVRKLDATEGNLNRVSDLLSEIRRQLKPLSKQAEVARKAALIQAEVRDAKARLIADDLVQAQLALQADLADEAAVLQRRKHTEAALNAAREAENEAEEAMRQALPTLSRAQETWYGLAALRERVASTMSIAAERMRYADDIDTGADRPARDPAAIEKEADAVAAIEAQLRADAEIKAAALAKVSQERADAEAAHAEEDRRLAAQIRAAADRREGLARLQGQVNSLTSRTDAAAEQIARLETSQQQAAARAAEALTKFTALEAQVAGLDEGEVDLDAAYETASEALANSTARLAELTRHEQEHHQRRASLAARLDGLRLGLARKDAGAALLAATGHVSGIVGSVASLLRVEKGYEAAVAAALGNAADAVAVEDLDAVTAALTHLKEEDLGRAGLLVGGGPKDSNVWPTLPTGARYVMETVECPQQLQTAMARLVSGMAVVDDLTAAQRLVETLPNVTAITREGDVISRWFSAGGSTSQPSMLEMQAAVDAAERELIDAEHAVEKTRFALAAATQQHEQAQDQVDIALARLHESDARMAAVAEELGQLNQTARAADGEAERLRASIQQAAEARDKDMAGLAELEQRLTAAREEKATTEPDATERDRLAEAARKLRSSEMETRLALRTVEERARGYAGRVEALRKQAHHERDAIAKATARREQLRREAQRATAVALAGSWLLARVDEARQRATTARQEAELLRGKADEKVQQSRLDARRLAKELEELVDSAHRDEMARTEQRLRLEALAEKAMTELGLAADVLTQEYGPDQLIPVLMSADGQPLTDEDEAPAPIPFVREEQAKRLRVAERQLSVLGRVNPLALEEFDAMQERHAFLAEQLEDVRKTRADLQDIINDVDRRVEEVFAAAYADVEQAFEHVFARLFPGGEGKLILTEPGQWLTTGIDVEARPAGKKVKRLSLLSGGERSLVAVAFLVSLFMARPSPFYILDEVEAALDDTNLGRLLEIYEELRRNSQLLVITHHKRTMEVADSLYGVTMRGDGVSTVISQRLVRET